VKRKILGKGGKVAVTFEIPSGLDAASVAVVGDFNAWNTDAAFMRRLRSGSWSKTISLLPGTHRYRYLADGRNWHNDGDADGYEPSGLGEDNSLIVVSREAGGA
jgi:1,4-alpha-glucan branching enzyme